jgi:signal transduction histidine kinase
VAERLDTVAEHRGVRVRVGWNCNRAMVAGDPNRVRQIFANLISLNGGRNPGALLLTFDLVTA